jgi:hypothetical protein
MVIGGRVGVNLFQPDCRAESIGRQVSRLRKPTTGLRGAEVTGTPAGSVAYVAPGAILKEYSEFAATDEAAFREEGNGSAWVNAIALLPWLAAGAVAFLPFAFGTSPWNAVMLRVPGNQGNWWHFLAGAPFFLAYPMIWLQLRMLFSTQPSTVIGRRLVWGAAGLSMGGTILVEGPFLLHLAGTSEWQRLAVLSLGFGIMVASGILLFLRRRYISPTRACVAVLSTAYLANAALCLVVYSDAAGSASTRSGWLVSAVIFWPILFGLIWVFGRTFRTSAE